MRIPRHLSLGLCALALAWCAARSQAGPITFISQDRSVQGIATIGTATDADLKNSTDPGRFDQTAAKTLSAGGTQASASASQQSFIDPDRLGSSGQLALALVNPSQGDSAEAHSRFLTSFQVNEPVLFSLRANMSGSLEFNGALRLGRSDLASFIIDTSLTPQQPDFSLDSQLGAGLYQLHFEPTALIVRFAELMAQDPQAVAHILDRGGGGGSFVQTLADGLFCGSDFDPQLLQTRLNLGAFSNRRRRTLFVVCDVALTLRNQLMKLRDARLHRLALMMQRRVTLAFRRDFNAEFVQLSRNFRLLRAKHFELLLRVCSTRLQDLQLLLAMLHVPFERLQASHRFRLPRR